MCNAMQKSLVTILCCLALVAGCGGGGGGTSPLPSPAVDTTPNAFVFTDQSNVTVNTVVTSVAITISGINTATPVSVVGGTYSINSGAFTAIASTLMNGDTVQVRHTSALTPGASTNTTLLVDGVSDVFTSTTATIVGADTTPDAFSFTDKTNVALATTVTSDPITITGINAATPVSVTGGTYSVGCTATYGNADSTINNNQTVCVRHTSSASANTAVDTVLTVGGVADTFTSATAPDAAPAVSLLPFLTGTGQVKLFDPTVAISGTNPATVDSGLTAPPITPFCDDCFAQATTFHTGTVSVTTVSDLRAARLAYVKRGPGNNTGGLVFVVNTDKGADNSPTPIGLILDACAIVKTQTTDFLDVDHSALVVERAGPNLSCSASTDNVVTVIRLDSLVTDLGTTIALALDAGNPLHAQTNALGEITGYLSFEIGGTLLAPTFDLVRRDADLANPVLLLPLQSSPEFGADTTGVNIEQSDLTHLYVTAIPLGEGLKLYRVETAGTLSPVLHSFVGFNAGNPIQDALHDATHLYFSDENRLLSTPVGSNSTADVTILTTMVHPVPSETLRIGNRAIDTSTTPARVVFEATDTGLTVDSGVFSVTTNATDATATVLDKYPDSLGGSATIVAVSNGRAYINHVDHGDQDFPNDADDALRINTDGTDPVTILSAYWPGRQYTTTFNLSQVSALPITTIFLATRVLTGLPGSSTGTETLRVVDPVTGAAGIVLGTVTDAANFMPIKIDGLGRYALARVEISRTDVFDLDVYSLDTATASSLMPLAQTAGANDVLLRD